jgi:cytidine deaminase
MNTLNLQIITSDQNCDKNAMESNYLEIMIEKATQVLSFSHTPFFGFPVSACIMTPDKQLFVGCNFENASFPLSVCAETSAIANMISAGHKNIQEILILNNKAELCSPCGGCRQQIFEFSTKDTLIHLYGNGILKKTLKVEDLLPYPFHF